MAVDHGFFVDFEKENRMVIRGENGGMFKFFWIKNLIREKKVHRSQNEGSSISNVLHDLWRWPQLEAAWKISAFYRVTHKGKHLRDNCTEFV